MLWELVFMEILRKHLGESPEKEEGKKGTKFVWFMGMWKRRLCDLFLKQGATSSSQAQS